MSNFKSITFTTTQHDEIHKLFDAQLMVQTVIFEDKEKEFTNIDYIEVVVPNFKNIIDVIEKRSPTRYEPAPGAVDTRTQIEFGYRYQGMNKMWKDLKKIAQQYNKQQLDTMGRTLPDLSQTPLKADAVSQATNKVLVYLKEQWQGYDYVNDPDGLQQETTTDFQVYIDIVRQVKTLQFFKQLGEQQQIQLLLKEFEFYKDLVLKYKYAKYMPQEDYGARNLKLINQNFQSQLKLDAVQKEMAKKTKQEAKAQSKLNKRNQTIAVQNQLLENRINYNNTFGKRVAMNRPRNIGGDFTDNQMDVETSKFVKAKGRQEEEISFNDIYSIQRAQFPGYDFDDLEYKTKLSASFDFIIGTKLKAGQTISDADYEQFLSDQKLAIQGLATLLDIKYEDLQANIGITKDQIQLVVAQSRKKQKT